MAQKGTRLYEIERSIVKTCHEELWTPFVHALKDFSLVNEGDRVAVCISGGKDSFLAAKLFQELKRHNRVKFDVRFMVMDPGYSPANRRKIEENAEILGIPIEIFETDIFNAVTKVEKNPCYLCARMRRGNLYKQARELGCNKIALGHHFDDVIETVLMGMFYAGKFETMMPRIRSKNFEGMELIRPLYYVRERDVIAWRDHNDLEFIRCACRFTERCELSGEESFSARQTVKELIAKLSEDNPSLADNIMKSTRNVNLATVLAYKEGGVRKSGLES